MRQWQLSPQDLDPWISKRALYQLHLDFRGHFEKATDLQARVAQLGDEFGYPSVQGVSRWVNVTLNGDTIRFMGEFEVTFPRQKTAPFRCLTDYVGEDQKVGLFAVTAGPYHDILETLFHQGRYQDCVIYHAVTVQLAEAGAEYIHHQMREGAGLERRPHLTQKEIEATIYTGKRFSFGYGACPDMSQQSLFAHCLPLDRIGVTLTPTWMLDPEASVTAMVFLDERCEYYFV